MGFFGCTELKKHHFVENENSFPDIYIRFDNITMCGELWWVEICQGEAIFSMKFQIHVGKQSQVSSQQRQNSVMELGTKSGVEDVGKAV